MHVLKLKDWWVIECGNFTISGVQAADEKHSFWGLSCPHVVALVNWQHIKSFRIIRVSEVGRYPKEQLQIFNHDAWQHRPWPHSVHKGIYRNQLFHCFTLFQRCGQTLHRAFYTSSPNTNMRLSIKLTAIQKWLNVNTLPIYQFYCA